MTKSSEITLTIHDVAFGGDGVGRRDGKAVFVPGVLPGEEVQAEIIEGKKNFARARLLKVTRPSPARIEPRCPYFGECPGCRYLHADDAVQLSIKTKQVEDLLRRIGKIAELPTVEAIPSPSPREYRNKIKLHVEKFPDKPGKNWKVGYIGDDNHNLVDIERCLIARPEINSALEKFRQEVAAENRTLRGAWLARTDAKGNTRGFFFEEGKEMTETMPLMKEEVQGHPFLSPFESFFQTNPAMLEKLAAAVERCLEPLSGSFLIDAYCGVGLFCLLLAKRADQAVGIEEDRRAIGVAQQNAQIQFVKNVRFLAAKVEEALPQILEEAPLAQTKLLLDPPRVGCHPRVIEALRGRLVPEIVYVSCNPATLARDASLLVQQGYRLTQVTLLDMFPQTAHIETVAKFVIS